MKILSEMPTEMGGKWVLVKYSKDFFAYGVEQDLHSIYGFPVNQCGTKEEVIKQCQSISELCKKNIKKYTALAEKENTVGWILLRDNEKSELEMLTKFIEVLKSHEEVYVIAGVELGENEAQKLVNEGKYIVKFSSIHKIMYSEERGYYAKCVHKISVPRGGVGFAKRGRFYTLSEEQVSNLIYG